MGDVIYLQTADRTCGDCGKIKACRKSVRARMDQPLVVIEPCGMCQDEVETNTAILGTFLGRRQGGGGSGECCYLCDTGWSEDHVRAAFDDPDADREVYGWICQGCLETSIDAMGGINPF